MFVCKLKDNTAEAGRNSARNTVGTTLIESVVEDEWLSRLKHSSSIVGHQNCDRILTQFWSMGHLRDSVASSEGVTGEPDLVDSLVYFADAYQNQKRPQSSNI